MQATLESVIRAGGVLRSGSRSQAVQTLQTALRAAGYEVRVDGDFGPSTDRFVREFQAKHGLTADGVVGLATAAQIDALHPVVGDVLVCPDGAPAWLATAWKEIGTKEQPENRGPAIRRYISLASAGAEGDPWCAIFVNAMLESVSVRGTRSASSQSFRHDDAFAKLPGPALGAIAVFWRKSHASGLGHVGFYCGERDRHVWTLGGNEGDMVQIEMLAENSPNFGLCGFWWPKGEALPKIGAINVSAAVPSHLVSVT